MCYIKLCDMLNMNPIKDTDLDVNVTRDDKGALNAEISLKIHKSVPEHKHVAFKCIFDEFQQGLGATKGNPQDTSTVDDVDYNDVDIDDITILALTAIYQVENM